MSTTIKGEFNPFTERFEKADVSKENRTKDKRNELVEKLMEASRALESFDILNGISSRDFIRMYPPEELSKPEASSQSSENLSAEEEIKLLKEEVNKLKKELKEVKERSSDNFYNSMKLIWSIENAIKTYNSSPYRKLINSMNSHTEEV